MALNLNAEADSLITAYQKREALPSKASAVNRLIILTLGSQQSAQQPTQTPVTPSIQTLALTPAQMPASPVFTTKFKL